MFIKLRILHSHSFKAKSILLGLSFIFALSIGALFCEVYFYLTKGDFFYKKSLHYQTQKKVDPKIPNSKDKTSSYQPLEEKIISLEVNDEIRERLKLPFTEGSDYQDGTVVFGAWIKAAEPGKVRLILVRDGIATNSPYHSGSGKWEFLVTSTPIKYHVDDQGSFAFDESKPVRYGTDFEILIASSGIPLQYQKVPVIIRPLRKANKQRPYIKYNVGYHKGEKVRVVCMGGSTTYGINMSPEKGSDYPYLLQQMFDALYPEKVDVLNYGWPAADTMDFLSLAEEIVLQGTDIILLVPAWNDNGDFLTRNYYYRIAIISPAVISFMETSLFNRIAIGYYLNQAMVRLNSIVYRKQFDEMQEMMSVNQAGGMRALMPDSETVPFNTQFYSELNRLVKYWQSEGIDVFLANLPYFRVNDESLEENPYIKHHFPDIHNFIATVEYTGILNLMDKKVIPLVASERGVTYVEIGESQAFKAISNDEISAYFHDAVHFTPDGTRIIAYEMFKVLLPRVVGMLGNKGNQSFPKSSIAANQNRPPPLNQAETIKNGDFETKNFDGWTANKNFRIVNMLTWRRRNGKMAFSDAGKGVLRSDSFTIVGDYLHFLLQGRQDLKNEMNNNFTGVKLFAGESLVASVKPTCATELCDIYISLKGWQEKTGRIEVIDGNNPAMIAVDKFSLQ